MDGRNGDGIVLSGPVISSCLTLKKEAVNAQMRLSSMAYPTHCPRLLLAARQLRSEQFLTNCGFDLALWSTHSRACPAAAGDTSRYPFPSPALPSLQEARRGIVR